MSDLLSSEKIKELEEQLRRQGRSIQCVDTRNRPGHPPDYIIRLKNGKEIHTCAYSYEDVLASAALMEDPA